jgi:hypothetical protein
MRTTYFPRKEEQWCQHHRNAQILLFKMGYYRLITAFPALFKKPFYLITIKPTEITEGGNKLESAEQF